MWFVGYYDHIRLCQKRVMRMPPAEIVFIPLPHHKIGKSHSYGSKRQRWENSQTLNLERSKGLTTTVVSSAPSSAQLLHITDEADCPQAGIRTPSPHKEVSFTNNKKAWTFCNQLSLNKQKPITSFQEINIIHVQNVKTNKGLY